MPTLDDDDGCDREDELPQVVVLKSGDLTADEVKKLTEEMQGKRGKGQDISLVTGNNFTPLWIYLRQHCTYTINILYLSLLYCQAKRLFLKAKFSSRNQQSAHPQTSFRASLQAPAKRRTTAESSWKRTENW